MVKDCKEDSSYLLLDFNFEGKSYLLLLASKIAIMANRPPKEIGIFKTGNGFAQGSN